MGDNISIELNLNSQLTKEEIFELRGFLRNELPGFEFNLKELPPTPGKMGGGFDQILSCPEFYAITVATIEVGLHYAYESLNKETANKISDAFNGFFKTNKRQTMEISGNIRRGNTKSVFKIDNSGLKYLNFKPYSIDPSKTFALLVGCGDFQSQAIPKIPPAQRNLDDMRRLLEENTYFGIPPENITVSLNQTSDVIQDQLYETSRIPGIETFIFYYVGHGFCTDKDSYFLAGYNTSKKNDFINSGIDKEFIKTRILAQSPAKQKIAIIDACYSGILTQGGPQGMFDSEVHGSYILASSGPDQVSFFEKDDNNTYFTSALIETLRQKINRNKDVITLDDLYIGTSGILKQKNLQEPVYKNGLNIDPSKFIISHNPAYSFEHELKGAEALIAEGKFEEASYQYKLLMLKHPDNEEIKQKAFRFDNEWMFTRLVKQGDASYYEAKDYQKAKEFYEKALELKNDTTIRDKLISCIEKSDEITNEPGYENIEITQEGLKSIEEKPISKKRLILFIISLLITAIAVYIGDRLHEIGTERARSTKEKQDSIIKSKEALEIKKKAMIAAQRDSISLAHKKDSVLKVNASNGQANKAGGQIQTPVYKVYSNNALSSPPKKYIDTTLNVKTDEVANGKVKKRKLNIKILDPNKPNVNW